MPQRFHAELIKGAVDGLVLAFLETGEHYGYEIFADLRDLSQGKIQFNNGTVYHAIRRLAKKGLVKRAPGEDRRKPYMITQEGKKVLARKRQEWTDFAALVARVMKGEIV